MAVGTVVALAGGIVLVVDALEPTLQERRAEPDDFGVSAAEYGSADELRYGVSRLLTQLRSMENDYFLDVGLGGSGDLAAGTPLLGDLEDARAALLASPAFDNPELDDLRSPFEDALDTFLAEEQRLIEAADRIAEYTAECNPRAFGTNLSSPALVPVLQDCRRTAASPPDDEILAPVVEGSAPFLDDWVEALRRGPQSGPDAIAAASDFQGAYFGATMAAQNSVSARYDLLNEPLGQIQDFLEDKSDDY